jgi:hypothetical protein
LRLAGRCCRRLRLGGRILGCCARPRSERLGGDFCENSARDSRGGSRTAGIVGIPGLRIETRGIQT